jgi:Mg2+-importing ATPase
VDISNSGKNRHEAARTGKPQAIRNPPSQRSSLRLRELSVATHEDALALLGSSTGGLTPREAKQRLARIGPNRLRQDAPREWYRQLAASYPSPFNLLLSGLAAVAAVLDGVETAVVLVLLLMISISTLMRFIQEYRSAIALRQLEALVPATAVVLRHENGISESRWERHYGSEVPVESLVPGDLIHLRAGDLVPADVRVLSSRELHVSQASLTGEALPVHKHESAMGWTTSDDASGAHADIPDLTNICCMGSGVVSGHAVAIVAATGDDTYFGSLAATLRCAPPPTSFDHGVRAVSWMLIRFTLVLVPIVLLVNGFIKGDWTEAFTFALAVGVGLTPEMLPVVVTGALARGAANLARHRVLTKRLSAIQNIGAIDVLCVDKTGTLTQEQAVLRQSLDTAGREDARVLELARLHCRLRGACDDPLDRALLQADSPERDARYERVSEIPFDFRRRRVSVVARDCGGREQLIAKGAVDEMLAVCSHRERDGATIALTPPMRTALLRLRHDLEADGARVIALATREFAQPQPTYGAADENGLVLRGLLAFVNPVRDDAADAIRRLERIGITIKLVTGDSERPTLSVADAVGLAAAEPLSGPRIDALDDAELEVAVARASVFVRTTPAQKARVVRALRARGHTVGFLGDGINDAQALRDADVGIAVAAASPIAREAADFILLAHGLLVVEQAVAEGRRMFGNIMKYLKMTTSANLGNVLSVLVAGAFLPFLPMQPIHLLTQNLLYDLSQILLTWDRVDDDFCARPQRWDPASIPRFALCMGPISSVFDFITFALMWQVFEANTPDRQALFQTGWFVEGLLSQTLIVHMIRTRHLPLVQSAASWPLVTATAVVAGAGLMLPFTAAGAAIGLVPLPAAYFAWLALLLFEYCVATQIGKTVYQRRYGAWL